MRLGGGGVLPQAHSPEESDRLHWQWLEHYGATIAAQLDPDLRYAVMRVGSQEFAYTGHSRYLGALGRAWAAGLDPEPLFEVAADDLIHVAPNLRGVDVEPEPLTLRAVHG